MTTTTMTLQNTPSMGVGRQAKRPTSSRNGDKPAIWIPMLQSTSKGKDLVEKQLIVLGGSPDQQREFLDQLNSEQDTGRKRFNQPRKLRTAPVSNKYALGYTYHDVLDADQEDILARMNVYMLSSPSAAFAPLIKPLLNSATVKDTLVTILLDWSEPWKWAKQLRQWIRLLRKVILSLDDETKIEMEEVMNAWKERRTGPGSQSQPTEQKTHTATTVPLGSGEWDEGLGLPLSVVCLQAENIEKLEKEQGWQEEHSDYLLQWIRTVLLRHGASLCYIASFDSNNVRTLLHSSLGIQSLLKKDVAERNVVDRDKILVPPNWDSWGKIRIMTEAFDVEGISERWSVEIQAQPEHTLDFDKPEANNDSAVALFEASIPKQPDDQMLSKQAPQITVSAPTLQEFLQAQKEKLDRYAAEDDKQVQNGGGRVYTTGSNGMTDTAKPNRNRVVEHIGSYQINVNGIDVDAEEATRRLREREQERHTSKRDGTPTGIKSKVADDKLDSDQMKSFFADLLNKKSATRGSTPAGGMASPRRGSPTPVRRTTDNS